MPCPICARTSATAGDDTFGIFPVVAERAACQGAAKVDINLMKVARHVVEFVDQTNLTHVNKKPSFFVNLTLEIVWQAAVFVGPPARGAPQMRFVPPRVDEEQTIVVHQDGADGEARCFGHGALMTIAWV